MCKTQSRLLPVLALILLIVAGLPGCKSKGKGDFPSDFQSQPIEKKMEFLVGNYSPEEVARIVCGAAMGESDAGYIDLPQARSYVYSHYSEAQIGDFEKECENFVDTLSLARKVIFAGKSATEDMEHYAFELGLGYVGYIRENGKGIEEIEREIEELKVASSADPDFFRRFMTAFKRALAEDHGKDLDENIYLHFISYPEK